MLRGCVDLLRDVGVTGAVFAVSVLTAMAWLRWARWPADANDRHRDRYLDGVRALAALAVMTSHLGGQIAFALAVKPPTALFHNLGTAGVQVFFALSGFLFTRKAVAARGQLALRPFFESRLRRIVPMYTAAIGFAVAVVCARSWRVPLQPAGFAHQLVSLYAFGFVGDGVPHIKDVAFYEVLGGIWSLPFEWLFYLSVPVLTVLVTWRFGLAVAAVVLALYFANLWADGRTDVFCPFFLPGMLLGALPAARLAVAPRWRTWLAAAAVLMTCVALLPGEQDFTASRLLMMTFLFGCVVLARPALLALRPIAFLGDISYSIYLMHHAMMFASKAVLRAFDPPGELTSLWAAALLATCGAVVAVSAITYRWIERPFLRRSAAVQPA